MARAVQLARLGTGKTKTNPLVGAVVVHDDRIIGEGYHELFGGPHAEVSAINAVSDKALLQNSTIYVTLEPCAHFGKTPPCVDLIIQSAIPRVVVGTRDPFDSVNGKGIERLRSSGVEVIESVRENECRELNRKFFCFHEKKRPLIVLKWAQSADGFIDISREAGETGIFWITAPETQVLSHKWRTESDAILCGWKTIATDNPSLTARAFAGPSPLRIIIDPKLKARESVVVFTDGKPTVVLNAVATETKHSTKWIQLSDFELQSVMNTLFQLDIQSVLVEGGAYTLKRFLEAGLFDEVRVLRSQTIIGSGLCAPALPNGNMTIEPFGADEVITIRR